MIEIELVMAAAAQDTITIEASHMSKVNPSKNKECYKESIVPT